MRVDKASTNQAQSAESSNVRKSAKAAAAEQAKKAQQSGARATSASTGGANVEISSRAREAAGAKAVATAAPDVREAKIAELKRRIAEGKYKIDNQAVADKMVDEHLNMSGMS